jgi:integrase
VKIKLKYLLNDPRNGKDRYYVRKTGHPKIRLRSDFGTPAFFLEYNNAFQSIISKQPRISGKFTTGKLGWLLNEYEQSPEFKSLNVATIKERSNIYARISRAYGELYIHSLTQLDIYALRDAQANTPAMANKFIKCLRYAFKWGLKRTLIDSNPSENVELLNYTVKGFPSLTADDVRKYLIQHPVGTKAHLAFIIAATINGRRGDIVKIGPANIIGNRIKYTQEKNKDKYPSEISIEVSPFLSRAIDTTETGEFTFLVTSKGRPYTKEGFGNQFKKWMEQAGVVGKNTHGVRKAFASWAAEGGATDEELMAGFGWRARSQVSTYTKGANRGTLTNSISDKTNNKLSHLFQSETKLKG